VGNLSSGELFENAAPLPREPCYHPYPQIFAERYKTAVESAAKEGANSKLSDLLEPAGPSPALDTHLFALDHPMVFDFSDQETLCKPKPRSHVAFENRYGCFHDASLQRLKAIPMPLKLSLCICYFF
jgi:hypothetical protein